MFASALARGRSRGYKRGHQVLRIVISDDPGPREARSVFPFAASDTLKLSGMCPVPSSIRERGEVFFDLLDDLLRSWAGGRSPGISRRGSSAADRRPLDDLRPELAVDGFLEGDRLPRSSRGDTVRAFRSVNSSPARSLANRFGWLGDSLVEARPRARLPGVEPGGSHPRQRR